AGQGHLRRPVQARESPGQGWLRPARGRMVNQERGSAAADVADDDGRAAARGIRIVVVEGTGDPDRVTGLVVAQVAVQREDVGAGVQGRAAAGGLMEPADQLHEAVRTVVDVVSIPVVTLQGLALLLVAAEAAATLRPAEERLAVQVIVTGVAGVV